MGLGIAALVFAASAHAETPPNIKGTWVTQTAEAIVDGPATHHPATAPNSTPAGKFRLRKGMTFTFTVEGQDGREVWGTVKSEFAVERLIGAFSIDGKRLYLIDDDGYLDATVVDADTIEICYRHVSAASGVVACNIVKRQK